MIEDIELDKKKGDTDLAKLDRISGLSGGALTNHATDEKIANLMKLDIIPYVEKARTNRQAYLGPAWSRYRDIYALRKNVSYYQGRAQLFLGVLRKSVDTTVRFAKESILGEPYIDVDTDIPDLREPSIELMRYLIEEQGKIRTVVPLYFRQLYTIGTSGLKIGWSKKVRNIRYRMRDEDTGKSKVMLKPEFVHYGPTIEVADMTRTYVWPETATSYENIRIVFEDTTTTVGKLKKDAKLYDSVALEKVIHRRELKLAEERKSNLEMTKENMELLLERASLDITKVYALMELPDVGETWASITMSGNDVLRVTENPWWFQHPPYLFGAIFRTHDYFYGHGMIEALEMWQYMLNDTANQTMDVGTFTLNPITLYDPEVIDDPDVLQMSPLAKWPAGAKAESVKLERPPAQMGIEGLTMVRFLINIIQEQSGANAIVQGSPREGLGRAVGTATGVLQLGNEAKGDILDQVSEQEIQVFTPLLKVVEIMAHEFLDDPMIIRLIGPDAITITQRKVTPEDLILSRDIRWVASMRAKQKFAQGGQQVNFLKIASQIPPQQLQEQGIRLNLKHIIKQIYSVSLGLPDVDKVIEDITPTRPDVAPELEEKLISSGRKIIASPLTTEEQQKTHIDSHLAFLEGNDGLSELVRLNMEEHLLTHISLQQQSQQIPNPTPDAPGVSGAIPSAKGELDESNALSGALGGAQ